MSDLYDEDFTLWTEQQATLLRRRAAGELTNDAALDWRTSRRRSKPWEATRAENSATGWASLLQHLLKWHYQPELRSRSWRATIRTQRQEIEDLLADNPSLRADCRSFRGRLPARSGRRSRRDRTARTAGAPPFTIEQALVDALPDG